MEKHKADLKIHVNTLIDWFKEIEKSFIDQFIADPDLNLAFNNQSGEYTIKDKSEKILSLLSLFMKNLLLASKQVSTIPKSVLSAIKQFSVNYIYITPRLLSTYEVNRLVFALDGRLINQTDSTMSMLIVFFVFIKTFIRRILLRIHDHYKEFKNFKYITISLRYFSSILQYVIEDLYMETPVKTREILVWLNYYRSYNLINDEIKKLKGVDIIKNSSVSFKDENEFPAPISKENLLRFFDLNKDKIKNIQKLIYQWGQQMGTLVRNKLKELGQL